MAKKTHSVEAKKTAGTKMTFEDRLQRLEELGDEIRKSDIPLDSAIKAFEEGITLSRALEKELEKIESRIEILMSGTEAGPDEKPDLGLFDDGE
ncbi:MAG: exodeoxyribonuclease VII small subunit [Treponema sp.]|nr:exodeoxyribonuclease VII small subunit [Treponema sp.]